MEQDGLPARSSLLHIALPLQRSDIAAAAAPAGESRKRQPYINVEEHESNGRATCFWRLAVVPRQCTTHAPVPVKHGGV